MSRKDLLDGTENLIFRSSNILKVIFHLIMIALMPFKLLSKNSSLSFVFILENIDLYMAS